MVALCWLCERSRPLRRPDTLPRLHARSVRLLRALWTCSANRSPAATRRSLRQAHRGFWSSLTGKPARAGPAQRSRADHLQRLKRNETNSKPSKAKPRNERSERSDTPTATASETGTTASPATQREARHSDSERHSEQRNASPDTQHRASTKRNETKRNEKRAIIPPPGQQAKQSKAKRTTKKTIRSDCATQAKNRATPIRCAALRELLRTMRNAGKAQQDRSVSSRPDRVVVVLSPCQVARLGASCAPWLRC